MLLGPLEFKDIVLNLGLIRVGKDVGQLGRSSGNLLHKRCAFCDVLNGLVKVGNLTFKTTDELDLRPDFFHKVNMGQLLPHGIQIEGETTKTSLGSKLRDT